MPKPDRVLLIIAPNITMAERTARAAGLDIATMENTRTILRPRLMRGWRNGTAYLASDPDSWKHISQEGEIMADLLFAAVRRGGLRPATEADVDAHKGERMTA